MTRFVSISQAARALNINVRAVQKAVQRSLNDGDARWHGAQLEIRAVKGRGGRSGEAYLIRADSLPPSLQAVIKDSERPVQLALKLDAPADAGAAWKEAFLRPATRTEKGTVERREAIRQLASAEQVRDGRRITVPERTIQRWMADFDAHGLGGLRRQKRRDAGKQAVLITRAWDTATAELPEHVRKRIAAQFGKHRRSLWGHGASFVDVKRLASEFLFDLTREAGATLTDVELQAACELPKHVVETDREVRRVHQYWTNRKRWDDDRARVRLTSAGLAPMQIVYGDVHHFDIYLEREDGSKATPKGIAWLDAATRRVRMDLVLCEPGGGIRNADLIASFISMTQDPRWGMPAKLYLDNGSEYGFADLAADALRLGGLECVTFGEKSPITRAQAYNAAAKGILEGSFGIFEKTILAVLPGYIGGNRMQSRSGNLGKAPVAWPGDFDAFCAQHSGMMAYWMSRQQKGDLKGLSPNQAFAQAVEAGWRRTDVDPEGLLVAFSVEDTRRVTDGKISVDGQRLYCDALAGLNGQTVKVRIPKYHQWPGIPVYTIKGGELIGLAVPEEVYRRDDPAGAVEAARRKGVSRTAVQAEAATVEPVDVAALMVASGNREPALPVPNSAGTIKLAQEDVAAGRYITATPEQHHDREHRARQDRMRERLALARKIKTQVQP